MTQIQIEYFSIFNGTRHTQKLCDILVTIWILEANKSERSS